MERDGLLSLSIFKFKSSIMKQTFPSIFLLASVLFACSDNIEFNSVDSSSNDSVITSFSAIYDLHDSRALIDDASGHLTWQNGDSISIFSAENSNPSRFITESNMDTATFKGSIAESSKYVGLYPHNPNSSFNAKSSTVRTLLKVQQNAVEKSFDPSSFLTVGVAKQQQISFRNVCGGIRFTVSKEGITRVVFSTLDTKQYLSGTVDITVSELNVPVATVVEKQSNSVELLCPDGFKTNTHYYITTLPVVLNQGFKFTFYKDDNTSWSTECNQPVEIKRSVFSTVNNADDQQYISKIKVPVDLSVDETANCYIISEAGYYKFRPTKGNTISLISGIQSVGIVWETANTTDRISEKSIIKSVSYRPDGYIYFETPDELKDGNALIAAYNGDIVQWSWHIWCCKDYDPDATSQRYKDFGRSAYLQARVMMDRNLGALSNSVTDALSNGLMYQWGRKDPFMGGALRAKTSREKMYSTHPSKTVNNWETTIDRNYPTHNPNTYICAHVGDAYSGDWLSGSKYDNLWTVYSSKKSQNDPCPPGWRIPTGGRTEYNPWTITKLRDGLEDFEIDKTNLGTYIELNDGDKAWYPCNGYLSAENSELKMMGQAAYYWSATPWSDNVFTFRIFIDSTNGVYRAKSYEDGKVRSEGHSVRCIKDI